MTPISTEQASYRKYLPVPGTTMAYVDAGVGDPIVFLHPMRRSSTPRPPH